LFSALVSGFGRSVSDQANWDRGFAGNRRQRRDQKGKVRMHARPTLGYHHEMVKGMMDASEPFGEVEIFIDEAAALHQDEKAAWSSRDPGIQKREALAILTAVGWWDRPD
jgi:hypothetical protein